MFWLLGPFITVPLTILIEIFNFSYRKVSFLNLISTLIFQSYIFLAFVHSAMSQTLCVFTRLVSMMRH